MFAKSTIPGVTILVCTYNGAARLPKTIQHIACQQVPIDVPWEVLIISNASSDDTLTAASRIWKQQKVNIPFQVLDEPQTGKENALVRGFAEAAYDFVAVVDDDNWLASDYVQRVYACMCAHPEIGILGTRAVGEFEVTPPEWFAKFEAVFAVGQQNDGQTGPLPGVGGYIYGAGSVVRKAGWERLVACGFVFTTKTRRGKMLSGAEDVELGDALKLAGYCLWYDDNIRFRHFMYRERLTWEYLLRMARSSASSQLTSIVYYFVLRHANLSENRFRWLYVKRLVWLLSQASRQPAGLLSVMVQEPGPKRLNAFEELRLLYNVRLSISSLTAAVDIFRQVRALQRCLQLSGKSVAMPEAQNEDK